MEQIDRPTNDEPENTGAELAWDDPLPDIPQADDASVPVTSPYPIDLSTDGITVAGALGMGTFNDDNDQGLFERTVDALEESGAESPMAGDDEPRPGGARIYEA